MRSTSALLVLVIACHGAGGRTSGDGRPGGADGPAVDAAASDGSPGDAVFASAPHPAFPQLPANQGTVLASPRIVSVVAPNDPFAPSLFQYGDALVASTWWTTVSAEYAVGPLTASLHLLGASDITTDLAEPDKVTYLQQAIAAADPSFQPDGRTIYVLLLPPGIDAGSPCSVGGSHHAFGSAGDTYGSVHRCADKVPYVASHEVIEAATDPSHGGYYLPFSRTAPWDYRVWAGADGEVGDLCEQEPTIVEGAFHYDRVWSNAAAAIGDAPCIPADPVPYFSLSAPTDWYAIAAGGTVDVPITAWSTAAVADWAVDAAVVPRPGTGTGAGFTATLSDATANNATNLTLTVAAPAGPSGSWALVYLKSSATVDGFVERHPWPVGFYIQ